MSLTCDILTCKGLESFLQQVMQCRRSTLLSPCVSHSSSALRAARLHHIVTAQNSTLRVSIALSQLRQGEVWGGRGRGGREPLAPKPNNAAHVIHTVDRRTDTRRANGDQSTTLNYYNDTRHHKHRYSESIIINACFTTSKLI